MAKNNNKTLIGIIAAVCVVVVVAVVAVVAINSNKGNNSSDSSNSSSNSSNETTTARVTANELENSLDASVMYGDYEKMQSLSKSIQNGEMTGKIVSIDGLVNHPGASYSVVQKNADGTTKIGTVFIIDDGTEYPADGTRISIVAKVVEVSPMNFQLVTLKDYIKEK